jgi:ABC transporter substrate binding protein
VDSLARPGGNITGFSLYEFSIIGKSLDMLKKIAPNIVRVALIYNSDNPATAFFVRSFEAFAGPLAVQPIILPVHGLGVMGMSRVWGLLLSRRVASQPSTTGMLGPEIGGAIAQGGFGHNGLASATGSTTAADCGFQFGRRDHAVGGAPFAGSLPRRISASIQA